MQLTTRGDWRDCEATRNAAAIAALGVPIAPQKTFRVREGNEQVTYLHAPASVWPHWQSLGPIKQVLTLWKSEGMDGTHAFAIARRAIHNVECLTRWRDQGWCCSLGYEPERHHTRLVQPGAPTAHPGPYARVASVAKAAALATLGFPVLAIEPHTDSTARYVLPRLSVPMAGDGAPRIYDAAELLAEQRADTLLPSHPFALACLAAQTYVQLLDIVADDAAILMFRSAGTRSSFVHSQASRDTLDHSEAYAAGRIV